MDRGKILTSPISKPRPSKWDDAQKWLAGFPASNREVGERPRDSNADDRQLLASRSLKGRHSCSSADDAFQFEPMPALISAYSGSSQDEGQTKRIDHVGQCKSLVRCTSMRDMGTETSPVESKEASRASTPRLAAAVAAVAASPVSSWLPPAGEPHEESKQCGSKEETESRVDESTSTELQLKAWNEAEQAKYMARYKEEEMRIVAWEDHEKQKAEMEMKRWQAKAEKMVARAEAKLASRLASAQAAAEEKRAAAESRLSKRVAEVGERAQSLRHRRPSSSCFSLGLPLLCGKGTAAAPAAAQANC